MLAKAALEFPTEGANAEQVYSLSALIFSVYTCSGLHPTLGLYSIGNRLKFYHFAPVSCALPFRESIVLLSFPDAKTVDNLQTKISSRIGKVMLTSIKSITTLICRVSRNRNEEGPNSNKKSQHKQRRKQTRLSTKTQILFKSIMLVLRLSPETILG